jgi:HK97 gp10 family phage protein
MSSSLNVQVDGFEELKNKIKALANDKDKKRESLILLREIARSTLNVSKTLVPMSLKSHKARGKKISPGNLKRSLGFITGKGSEPTIYVGPRAKRGNDGWYGHFVHEGFNIYRKGYKRKRKKGANHAAALRRTRGNPFLRKAYERTQGKVTAESEQKFAAFIQKRIDKLSRS